MPVFTERPDLVLGIVDGLAERDSPMGSYMNMTSVPSYVIRSVYACVAKTGIQFIT